MPKEYFNKSKAADRTKYQKMEGWLQKPSHRMRLVKGGDTPADDEILLKKVFMGKKCMGKKFLFQKLPFLRKEKSRASVRFSSYV